MKRFFLSLFLLCSILSFGQVDIKSTTIGPYVTLIRQAAWGAGGIGHTDNSYIYTPQTSAAITCVYIANNNPTNTHTYTLKFLTTGDPSISSFAQASVAIQDKWHQIGSTVSGSTAANMVSVYGFSSLAAASAQIQISASSTAAGSPDTADIYIVQSNSNIDCSTSSVPIAGPVTVSQIVNIPSCTLSATGTIATASTITLIAAPPASQFIHVCAVIVSGDVVSNGTTVDFANGSAGTCASPGTIKWQVSPHTGGSNAATGSGIGQIFQTTVAAQPLCVTTGAVGANQVVSISYMLGT